MVVRNTDESFDLGIDTRIAAGTSLRVSMTLSMMVLLSGWSMKYTEEGLLFEAIHSRNIRSSSDPLQWVFLSSMVISSCWGPGTISFLLCFSFVIRCRKYND